MALRLLRPVPKKTHQLLGASSAEMLCVAGAQGEAQGGRLRRCKEALRVGVVLSRD